MITDMLALLVLTVIVGMATGVIGEHFWTRLSISIGHIRFICSNRISYCRTLVFQACTGQHITIYFRFGHGFFWVLIWPN